MPRNIRYIHTNIIAKDWQKLAQFYIDAFNCEPIYPERDLKGEWMDSLTNIKDVHVKGIHLRLPGYENGPTLEIFSYNLAQMRDKHPEINAQGFGHLAFHVDNVDEVLEKLIKYGGTKYGEMVEKKIEGLGIIIVIYAKDPEGNIIEIQNWKNINN
jgi:predicted enzyme related to lactoylglutathione lyase